MAVYTRLTPGRVIFNIVNYTILTFLAAITLYPFLYVLAASLSDQSYLMQGKFGIIPVGFNLEAYKRVFEYPLLGRAYLNTVFYTIAGVAINMLLTACGAYPLSRNRFPGKSFFNFLITITMLFNGGLIPTFLVVKGLGMYNTVWALIIPFAINSWYLIILKTFFQQIPASIEESALIDGTNEIQCLFKIILPLSVPALLTITLFYAVLSWNAFFTAMIYLKEKSMMPLQLLVRQIVLLDETDAVISDVGKGKDLASESVKHATIIVAALPIIMVYPFIQKYFVKGVMVGAIKG